ncbi:MAG: PAS domain S-box protein, partial [Proteobacteria bacterium]
GTRVPVLLGASLITDVDDQSFCFVLDLTNRKQVEEALRKSEMRFRTVVDNLAEGLIICDANGKLTHWNSTALDLFGFSNSDEWLRGMNEFDQYFELLTLDGQPLTFAEWPLTRIMNGEVIHTCDLRIRRSDMEWNRIFSFGGSVVRDENNNTLLGFLTVIDITERKQAEAELQASQGLLSGIINSALDAIITIDGENRIIEFNPAAEQIFGYRRSEVIGRSLSDTIIPTGFQADVNDGLTRYFEIGLGRVLNQRLELTATRADGTQFPVELSATSISQDGKIVYAGFLRDITERKRAEVNLKRANDELELRVERRTSELAQINKTLKGEIVERQTVMGALRETVVQLEMAKEDSDRANKA